jgi:crotonobetainyl-CoA:carnitine CoA-transferase CaiB-like acyl-CoA transferase
VQMPDHMRGDDTLGGQDGSDYQYTHRNKRSVTLNLKEPEGIAALKRLIATADVVVENFRPDVKFRLGIDYESLSRSHPRLVYASISGFGQTGPLAERPGFDQIAQGMGGLMSVTGLPGQGPVRVGIPIADLCAGIFAAQGILVALLERERSGKGQWVHTSLLQAMVTMLDFQAARWLIGHEIPPQAGNDHPTAIPTGVFKTADGHLNIAASGQHMFRRLCEALGTEPLLDDPRFRTAPDRSRNRKALAVELEKGFAKRTTQEWVEVLNAKGVPSGPILDVKQVYEDEQIRHLKMAVPVKHPALGELLVQAPPVTLSRTPGAVRTPAPDTGEHNDQILTELGYSPSDIDTLRKNKVI